MFRKRPFPVLAAVWAAVSVMSCGESQFAPGVLIASLTLSPTTAVMPVGTSSQFAAAARDAQNNILLGQHVDWSSSNASVATVSETGRVTAVAEGTAIITATAAGRSATAAVTVLEQPIVSISVAPTPAALTVGNTIQLSATAFDEGGNALAGRTFTWTSSNSAVATVSGTGVVNGIGVGPVTILAAAEGVSGAATVNVSAQAATIVSIVVSPAPASVVRGQTIQLSASARDGNGNHVPGQTFNWTSSDTTIATVTANGSVRGVRSGSATIRASTAGVTGASTVSVTEPPVVTTVTISPAPASVQAGATIQLAATARDQSGNAVSGQTFTWTSSNTAVATVSSSGLVTGLAAGTATITATTAGVSGASALTVTAAASVASVSVTPAPASVQAGGSIQLSATARDAGGNAIPGQTFTWTSSNTAVATVSSAGAVSGVAAGSATITATTSGVAGSSALTVTAASGNAVLFFSDWRTARGNTLDAVTDGGKWNFVSAEHDQTMDIVATTGLDFPTANAYRVIGTASRSGWSELRHTSLPIPAVGQSRYFRWYMRITMPDGLVDDQTHPIQDNYLENWGFIVYNGGGGAGVPNGMWRPEFWSMNSNWPLDRWRGPNLYKNRTYRIEMQLDRTGTSTYRMHVRIYDSAGNLVADDSNIRDNANGALLSTNPTLSLGNVNALNGITAGNNGIGNNPPFPFTISYQAAFAVCATTWCGAYNGSY